MGQRSEQLKNQGERMSEAQPNVVLRQKKLEISTISGVVSFFDNLLT